MPNSFLIKDILNIDKKRPLSPTYHTNKKLKQDLKHTQNDLHLIQQFYSQLFMSQCLNQSSCSNTKENGSESDGNENDNDENDSNVDSVQSSNRSSTSSVSPLDALFQMANRKDDENVVVISNENKVGNCSLNDKCDLKYVQAISQSQENYELKKQQHKKNQALLHSHSQSQQSRKRKNRTAFTAHQIYELERHFSSQRYLSPSDRDRISQELSLSTSQVITWFQNRRAKQKRDIEEIKNDKLHAMVDVSSSSQQQTDDLSNSSYAS